eukprot:05824_6
MGGPFMLRPSLTRAPIPTAVPETKVSVKMSAARHVPPAILPEPRRFSTPMPSGPMTAERQCRFVPSDAVTSCVSAICFLRSTSTVSSSRYRNSMLRSRFSDRTCRRSSIPSTMLIF